MNAHFCSFILGDHALESAPFAASGSRRAPLFLFLCFVFSGNLTKHMKSKAHGKKCQAMGVSESSLDEPESEETGTHEWAGETIGTQLDERHVKARSCSALAAYAMPCSILLPLALHKKCEKVMNKEHGVFDSFLQECPVFSRVHTIFFSPQRRFIVS